MTLSVPVDLDPAELDVLRTPLLVRVGARRRCKECAAAAVRGPSRMYVGRNTPLPSKAVSLAPHPCEHCHASGRKSVRKAEGTAAARLSSTHRSVNVAPPKRRRRSHQEARERRRGDRSPVPHVFSRTGSARRATTRSATGTGSRCSTASRVSSSARSGPRVVTANLGDAAVSLFFLSRSDVLYARFARGSTAERRKPRAGARAESRSEATGGCGRVTPGG